MLQVCIIFIAIWSKGLILNSGRPYVTFDTKIQSKMDFLIDLNFLDYSVTRLDPAIRANLIKSTPSQKPDFTGAQDQVFTNRDRQLVSKELENFFGSPQKVFFSPVLPYDADMHEIVL